MIPGSEVLQPSFCMNADGTITQWNVPMAAATGLDAANAVGHAISSLVADMTDNVAVGPARISKDLTFLHGGPRATGSALRRIHLRTEIVPGLSPGTLVCRCADVTETTELRRRLELCQAELAAEQKHAQWVSHKIRNYLSVAAEASITLRDDLQVHGDSLAPAALASPLKKSGKSGFFPRRKIKAHQEAQLPEDSLTDLVWNVDLISRSVVSVVDLLRQGLLRQGAVPLGAAVAPPAAAASGFYPLCGPDSCIVGHYRLLVVDDDRMSRKLLRRRLSRLFPHADVDEADSGETAVERTAAHYYDVIFMDQYMGDGMCGDETIRHLRDACAVDSLVIGISGNEESDAAQIASGAEDFFTKPLPPDGTFLTRMAAVLPPPAGWEVLVADGSEMAGHFLVRKLHKVSTAHYLDLGVASTHWNITVCADALKTVETLEGKAFDLIVLDNSFGAPLAARARETPKNGGAIIALTTGSADAGAELLQENGDVDIVWPKPLPNLEQMRRDLCHQLIKVREKKTTKSR